MRLPRPLKQLPLNEAFRNLGVAKSLVFLKEGILTAAITVLLTKKPKVVLQRHIVERAHFQVNHFIVTVKDSMAGMELTLRRQPCRFQPLLVVLLQPTISLETDMIPMKDYLS